MGLFIDTLKVKAAARSLHQFCPAVRAIFPKTVPDAAVEISVVFLYLKLARDVFGKRFALRLWDEVRESLKYADDRQVTESYGRIRNQAEALEHAEEADEPATAHLQFERHVCSVIRALLVEAGCATEAGQKVGPEIYQRFEVAVSRIKEHLAGIKRQNHYLMR